MVAEVLERGTTLLVISFEIHILVISSWLLPSLLCVCGTVDFKVDQLVVVNDVIIRG